MIKNFDYIIIGSGIAGNICAYQLQKKSYSCLILEKSIIRCEKVCGGGIPYKALEKMKLIGMNIDALMQQDVALIKGDISYRKNKVETCIYDSSKFAIGCRRTILDNFLLEEALKQGAKVQWGTPVKKIVSSGSYYNIANIKSREIVVAVGARGLLGKYYSGQSIGMSIQIYGESKLPSDMFSYYYFKENNECYFWVFPIGRNIWNIGLWSRVPYNDLKKDFYSCWYSYIKDNFRDYHILQPLKTEFCGNVDLSCKEGIPCKAIGDYSGTNNIKNGGGIYKAIKSVLEYTNEIGEAIHR